MEFCPVCGELIDYCQGHGEIGDPIGYQILKQHEEGDHTSCDRRGCQEVDPYELTFQVNEEGDWELDLGGYTIVVSGEKGGPYGATAIWGNYPFPHDKDLNIEEKTPIAAMNKAVRWLKRRIAAENQAADEEAKAFDEMEQAMGHPSFEDIQAIKGTTGVHDYWPLDTGEIEAWAVHHSIADLLAEVRAKGFDFEIKEVLFSVRFTAKRK